MTMVYSEEVKAMLRASGMSDTDILKSEQKLAATSKKLLESGPATPEQLGTLPEKYASQPLTLMGDELF